MPHQPTTCPRTWIVLSSRLTKRREKVRRPDCQVLPAFPIKASFVWFTFETLQNAGPKYAVLGLNGHGIFNEHPFIVSGKDNSPFPLAVQCRSQAEAEEVFQLQPFVVRLLNRKPKLMPVEIAFQLLRIDGFKNILVKPLGVLRKLVNQALSGSRFVQVHHFDTFQEAFLYMVTRGVGYEALGLLKGQVVQDETSDVDSLATSLSSSLTTTHASEPLNIPTSSKDRSAPSQEKGPAEKAPAAAAPASTPSDGELPASSRSFQSCGEFDRTNTPFVPSQGLEEGERPTQAPVSNRAHGGWRQNMRHGPPRECTPSSARASSRIVTHVRGIAGIERTVTEADLSLRSIPEMDGLSDVLSSYLLAHGYTEVAINFLHASLQASSSAEQFVETMALHGMPMMESLWIWEWK
ncbi:hypothetical protein GALMADRAFT_216632 [Galerina marginata CBS 339.88]|uniref:Uncharacterized protein n=1 Tax=Galerina marginata (strain CBS 339.88) TaxID=685588 RepID=A0A067SK56_GALM3|nr:hypothetical protein GALMADRAFT_216632 [Galerina marginata CBS 339.88]